MIAVVDYDAGNLASVANALRFLDVPFEITKDPLRLVAADGILLPGVGAFPDAMARIESRGLVDVLQEEARRKPFLGICLGLQVLFEVGEEFRPTKGLGLIPGRVRALRSGGQKLPHIGWNSVTVKRQGPLTAGIVDGNYFYYVHSFCAETDAQVVCLETIYGEPFPGMVQYGETVFGCQFHPEKSGPVGLQVLKNFGRLVDDYTTGN